MGLEGRSYRGMEARIQKMNGDRSYTIKHFEGTHLIKATIQQLAVDNIDWSTPEEDRRGPERNVTLAFPRDNTPTEEDIDSSSYNRQIEE
jgi:hypothetical protein